MPQQLPASPALPRVRRPRDLHTRRRRRQGPPPYDAAGMAGTLDSPAPGSAIRPRSASPAAPITREERAPRQEASPRLGNCGGEDEGALRSGCRGQRAAWRGNRGGGNSGDSRGASCKSGRGWGGRASALAWLGWSGGGRPRREDEVGEREEEWEMGKEILATSFLVLLGAVLPFRPPRFARFLKWSPAWASCCWAGSWGACRMTR